MRDDILKTKSFNFALRIVRLYKYLCANNEFILSKQVLRSGTSIGAMVSEAKFAQSMPDFISKLSIGLKEANETLYWIELLYQSEYLDNKMYESIEVDIQELIKLLVSSVKTAKSKS